MAKQLNICFDAGSPEFQKMIKQRAEQEGIDQSSYIRGALMFEMVMSGDVQALKFVSKRARGMAKEFLASRLSAMDGQAVELPHL